MKQISTGVENLAGKYISGNETCQRVLLNRSAGIPYNKLGSNAHLSLVF